MNEPTRQKRITLTPLTGTWRTRCCVCRKEYENGVGSTQCCGSLQEIIEHNGVRIGEPTREQLEADCAAMREALQQISRLRSYSTDDQIESLRESGNFGDMAAATSAQESRFYADLADKALATGSGSALLEKAKKADDWLDTLRAIYERLGIKEGDVPGDEKVGITVKRYVDRVVENADRLAAALENIWIRVAEMAKDARTDYMLPELAAIDLQAILSTADEVREALTAHRKGADRE